MTRRAKSSASFPEPEGGSDAILMRPGRLRAALGLSGALMELMLIGWAELDLPGGVRAFRSEDIKRLRSDT